MKIIATCFIVCSLLSSISFGEGLQRGRTYETEDNWVTDYLRRGGDMKNITGLVQPSDWRVGAIFDDIVPLGNLPPKFDWRQEVGGLQPVRDQGECGSCWAFSTVGVLESLLVIANSRLPENDLAEQTLVSRCYRKADCDGGYFSAFKYIKSSGLPSEGQDPYLNQNSPCKSSLDPIASISSWAYIGKGYRAPSTQQMKTAIYKYGPISVDVNADFVDYASGIFNDCNNETTDHMVVIVGWNDDGQYWIMRNSWGASWGEDGYMRIRYKGENGRKCNNIGKISAYAILQNHK